MAKLLVMLGTVTLQKRRDHITLPSAEGTAINHILRYLLLRHAGAWEVHILKPRGIFPRGGNQSREEVNRGDTGLSAIQTGGGNIALTPNQQNPG